MNRYQLHDRLDALQGELRAAEEQDRLNAQELADREHAQRLASEAKAKSEANIARIRNEIREAGQAYSELVLQMAGVESAPVAVEFVAAAEPYPNAIFNGVEH